MQVIQTENLTSRNWKTKAIRLLKIIKADLPGDLAKSAVTGLVVGFNPVSFIVKQAGVAVLAATGFWAYGMLYYRDGNIDDSAGVWEILADYGTHGAWFEYAGLLNAKEQIKDWILDIARAYKIIDPAAPAPKENGFYLEHGYIALPYLEQEETYARFEGHPLELKLEFTTRAVHEVSESSLVERLAASLAMNFAPGVDVDKLRTGKRSVAGLNGEEVIFRGTQDGKSELSFTWLFTGKADSGNAPKISIEMEAPDGHVEEKMRVWDAILDSIKAPGR